MKQVQFAAFGTPHEVAECVEVPDVGEAPEGDVTLDWAREASAGPDDEADDDEADDDDDAVDVDDRGDARRPGVTSVLRIPEDPSQLSFLLTGILQVEPVRKQALLEATSAERRLRELDRILDRELVLLRARLAPYRPDRGALGPHAS